MKFLRLLSILVMGALLSGCGEPNADLSTPRTHQSGNISLAYPKNWKITEESITQEIHSFFIESSGNALVIFQSYPIEDAGNLTDFSKSFSDVAKRI